VLPTKGIVVYLSRHPGRDSLRALTGAGIQTPWMDMSLPSMALDTRFPAGMTSNLYICV